MSKAEPNQITAQKAMVWAWITVAALWSLGRFIVESVQPTELGWGPIVYAIEMIYIALLGMALIVFASFREKGIRGSSCIVAGSLLGLVLPLYDTFSGSQLSWPPFFFGVAPGFALGLVYAMLRKSNAGAKNVWKISAIRSVDEPQSGKVVRKERKS